MRVAEMQLGESIVLDLYQLRPTPNVRQCELTCSIKSDERAGHSTATVCECSCTDQAYTDGWTCRCECYMEVVGLCDIQMRTVTARVIHVQTLKGYLHGILQFE